MGGVAALRVRRCVQIALRSGRRDDSSTTETEARPTSNGSKRTAFNVFRIFCWLCAMVIPWYQPFSCFDVSLDSKTIVPRAPVCIRITSH